MRVLVTGGAGFIGSNIVKLLESKGAKVVVLDNFSCADYKNLLDTKADVVCADVADPLIFRKLPKFDAVIHEAAITDTTLADNAKMMQVNFTGSENILGFCFRKKIKLVYASSAGVYGDCKFPAKESQKLVPHNTYAYSKYLFDCLVQKTIKKVKTPLIVGLRYFNVYGPGEVHKGTAASMTYQLYLQILQMKCLTFLKDQRSFPLKIRQKFVLKLSRLHNPEHPCPYCKYIVYLADASEGLLWLKQQKIHKGEKIRYP